MEMISVDSSNILAIGYSSETATLRVRFKDGKEYDYYSVPVEIYDAFMASSSKGKFLFENIRGRFGFARL